MTQNSGTLTISSVRPNDTLDNFPVFVANELKGNIKSYDTLAELNSISVSKRQAGMLVQITDELDPQLNNVYILDNNLTTWRYYNSLYNFYNKLETLHNLYTFNILLSSPYRFKIESIYFKTDAGSCELTFYTGLLAVEGLSTLLAVNSINSVIPNIDVIHINNNTSFKFTLNNCSLDLRGLSVQVNLKRDFLDLYNLTESVIDRDSDFRYYLPSNSLTTISVTTLDSFGFITNYLQVKNYFLTSPIIFLNVI
jgi:hypothetical protein